MPSCVGECGQGIRQAGRGKKHFHERGKLTKKSGNELRDLLALKELAIFSRTKRTVFQCPKGQENGKNWPQSAPSQPRSDLAAVSEPGFAAARVAAVMNVELLLK